MYKSHFLKIILVVFLLSLLPISIQHHTDVSQAQGCIDSTGAPIECPDADSDGIPDDDDQCPREAGPAENRGCPQTDTGGGGNGGSDTTQDATPEPTTAPLAFLPQDSCHIATPSQTPVNVRDFPSLLGNPVGTVDPVVAIPVFMRFAVAPEDGANNGDANGDGTVDGNDFLVWHMTSRGFVSADVMRQSAVCDRLPIIVLYPDTIPTPQSGFPFGIGENDPDAQTREHVLLAGSGGTSAALVFNPEAGLSLLLPPNDGNPTLPKLIFQDPSTLPEPPVPGSLVFTLPDIDPMAAVDFFLKLDGIPGESRDPFPFFDILLPPPDTSPSVLLPLASIDGDALIFEWGLPLADAPPANDDDEEEDDPSGTGTCSFFGNAPDFVPQQGYQATELNGFTFEPSHSELVDLGFVKSNVGGEGWSLQGGFSIPNVYLPESETLSIAYGAPQGGLAVEPIQSQMSSDLSTVGNQGFQSAPIVHQYVSPATSVYQLNMYMDLLVPPISIYASYFSLQVACDSAAIADDAN